MKEPGIPKNELKRLSAIADLEILDTPSEPAFDTFTKVVAYLLEVPIALISIVDTDRQWFKSRYGLDIPQSPRNTSFCGHVVSSGERLIVEDALKDDRFFDNPLVTGSPHIRFYVGYPLKTSDGLVIGTLCAIDTKVRSLKKEQQEIIELLAKQTIEHLELRRKARLLIVSEQKIQESLHDLKKSHEDLTQILNKLRIGTMIITQDQCISFTNKTCLTICNKENEDVIGQRWDDVLDINDSTLRLIQATKEVPELQRTRLEIHIGTRNESSRPVWVELDLRDDPRNPENLIFMLYDISTLYELRQKLSKQRNDQIIGESAIMHELYQNISQIAAGEWTVLVEGETGAGKELVARAIHAASPRHEGTFLAVNCAGLTDSLLSSQLFGHIKGSFTGATSDQEGLFDASSGGTLFLDEIGDISSSLQAALLRVLEEREIVRVGETKAHKVNTRIIFATNRDLKKRVDSGQFREDLLYRIRGARIRVPPLRERREDIPLLVSAFLTQQRVCAGRFGIEVSPQAMQELQDYKWPGNVRELKAAMEFAVFRCKTNRIEVKDLPFEIVEARKEDHPLPTDGDEQARFTEALKRCGNNRAKAARLLGVSRATFYRHLKELEKK